VDSDRPACEAAFAPPSSSLEIFGSEKLAQSVYLSAPTTYYSGADIAITLSRCVRVYVYCHHDKTKTRDRNDLKLCTLVVFDRLSKTINFGFKRSRVKGTGSLACEFRVRACRPLDEEPGPQCGVIQSNLAFRVGVALHFHRVHILVGGLGGRR